MSDAYATATLGALVAERPQRAELFERLHLDYCCGGGMTLLEACAARGLDANTLSQTLHALDAADLAGGGQEEHDWRQASVKELCEHITTTHHARLRAEFPRIGELLATVVRVHADSQPILYELQDAFQAIRTHLEPHLDSEEQTLFPSCVALERGGPRVSEDAIGEHVSEHRQVGEQITAMRALGGDYDTDKALCSTHRSLLEALTSFESDLHRHVHEENNVLFPRVRRLSAEARA